MLFHYMLWIIEFVFFSLCVACDFISFYFFSSNILVWKTRKNQHTKSMLQSRDCARHKKKSLVHTKLVPFSVKHKSFTSLCVTCTNEKFWRHTTKCMRRAQQHMERRIERRTLSLSTQLDLSVEGNGSSMFSNEFVCNNFSFTLYICVSDCVIIRS